MTVGGAPSDCPEAWALAAYVEGDPEPGLRRDVERHVADCPECAFVLAETSRFLQESAGRTESDTTESKPQYWWAIAAAVAVVALGLPTAMHWMSARADPLADVKQIAASRPLRPVEGRLAGFAYAPLDRVRSQQATPRDDIAFRAEAERLTRSLHARGVALLLAGDVREAEALLDRAARGQGGGAPMWNDLAAAHLAAGAIGDESRFREAVAAAGRAATLDPMLAAAHFNRAVGLERLGRADEAVRAYRRAIVLDPRSRWSDEASFRIARLRG